MSKPDSLATAVQLWGKVAERFASETREDLFFELLNEPELSFATGAAPTQTQWTTLAEQMIAAIRTTDKVHSLIFGESLTRDTRVPCTLDRRLASPSLVNAIADLSGVN